MQTKLSPYEPITTELAASGLLITIKQSAADEEACESTLRANAKCRRLPAYQSHFGAPVMVLRSDVVDFLKSRPDIASKHHPKNSPSESAAGLSSTLPESEASDGFPFPDARSAVGPIGDLGIGISLRALNHSQPAEIALVANCLIEVGRQLNALIPSPHANTEH
jgi:hypothetical protein